MDARKLVIRQTVMITIGELICSGIMVGIFAALGKFSLPVLLGALTGCLVMIVNYFFMAITVNLAADRAQKGQVEQAKKMIQLSSVVRLLLMGGAMVLGVVLGANVVAMVLPLAFVRPILMIAEFFGKKGD
jgi:hypothetical protein